MYNFNGGAIPWHTRLLLHASAAALAPMLAPLVLSLRVTISSSSTLVLAWTAVLAQIPAPTAQSFPRTNFQGIHKNLVSFTLARFFCFCFGYPRQFSFTVRVDDRNLLPRTLSLAGSFVFLYNDIDNNWKR
jgi:hypothetical protein